MNIKRKIEEYKKKIDDELKIFFEGKIKKVKNVDERALELFEHLMEFNLRGGKRIRPILTIFGYKCFKEKKEEEIIKAALAVELMESFLLVHDDVMDEDDIRRGYLTMHKLYQNYCDRHFCIDSKKFGESMGILAGDVLAMLGNDVLLKSKFPNKLKLKAIQKFNSVIINTCFGQILDLESKYRELDEKDIRKIHELKTAIYTIEGPLHIGAILAGAKKKKIDILTKYAIPLGKAFQLQDDILDLYGDQKKLGKPIGSDVREGKKTMLIVKALEKCSNDERQFIKKCLGNKKISEKDVIKIRKIIEKTKALEYSKNLAKDYAEQAKSIIKKNKFKKQGKLFLLSLADYIISREY